MQWELALQFRLPAGTPLLTRNRGQSPRDVGKTQTGTWIAKSGPEPVATHGILESA